VGAGADDRCRTRLYAVREWSQLDDLPSDGMNFLAPTNLAPGGGVARRTRPQNSSVTSTGKPTPTSSY